MTRPPDANSGTHRRASWPGAATWLACWMVVWVAHVPPLRAQSDPLRVWHAYGGAERAALEQATAAFSRETGTPVELLPIPFGAYATKLETAIPAGAGPDVFIDAHERLADYQARGLVRTLDVSMAPFDARSAAALHLRNGQYGLPLSIKCAALYVNRALASGPPPSLSALLQPTPSGPHGWGMQSESSYYVAALLHAEGAGLLSSDGTWQMRGPGAERVLTLLRALADAGAIPQEPTAELIRQMFNAGRLAYAVGGPWLAPGIDPSVSFTVHPLPPVFADGRAMQPFATIEGVFAAASSRPHSEAVAYMTFLATRGWTWLARVGGQVPTLAAAWADPAVSSHPTLPAFRRACQGARTMPTHANMRAAFAPADGALKGVLRMDLAPRTALQAAEKRFAETTRPLPPRAWPVPWFAALGLAALAGALGLRRAARDASVRARLRASLPAYAYVGHALLAVGVLVVGPLLVGALASLFAGRQDTLRFVGFSHYWDILRVHGGPLLGSGSFYRVLAVTLGWTALNLALHVTIGGILALALYDASTRIRPVYRVLLVLPWALPSYVTALAWKGLFHKQMGAINALLALLDIPAVSWFSQFSTAFCANVVTNVWLGFPFMMVLTLAGLSQISKDLYEAADLDGATRWQQFRWITLPLLAPILGPSIAISAMWTFNMFNVVYLVSEGEPGGSTEILVSEAYRWAFTRSAQLGYGAAYAVLIFGVVLLLGTGPRRLRLLLRGKATDAPPGGDDK